MKVIQSEKNNMEKVIALFDALLEENYLTGMEKWLEKYLSIDADIIQCPEFETTTTKCLNDKPHRITGREKKFLKPSETNKGCVLLMIII